MARGVRKDADCDDPYGKPTEYIHDGGQPLRGTPPDAPAVVPNDKEVENRVGPLAQTAHEGASQDSNTWSYHHVPRALGTLESVNSCPEPVPPNSPAFPPRPSRSLNPPSPSLPRPKQEGMDPVRRRTGRRRTLLRVRRMGSSPRSPRPPRWARRATRCASSCPGGSPPSGLSFVPTAA